MKKIVIIALFILVIIGSVLYFFSKNMVIKNDNNLDKTQDKDIVFENPNLGLEIKNSIFEDKVTLPSSSNYNIIFKYGFEAKNVLNTFDKTFTKDMINEKLVTIKFELSEEELKNIHNKIIQLDLFNKTSKLSETGNTRLMVPCSNFYLKTQNNSISKEMSWDDCSGETKEEFKQFTDYVIKIIESKNEYKNLPAVKGGYL